MAIKNRVTAHWLIEHKDFPTLEIAYSGELLAGVDEVGRGPLVGSVVAAAVILDPAQPINGLTDSKKLTASRRCRSSWRL